MSVNIESQQDVLIDDLFSKLSSILSQYGHILPNNHLIELTSYLDDYKNNKKIAQQEGRNLRIAIVGQMKAGKSSFLNALLFPVDILPKAATPMTAALTKIAYSEKPYVDIQFYSKNDWRQIEENAQEYINQYQKIEQRLIDEQSNQKNSSFLGGFAKFGTEKSQKEIKISSASVHAHMSSELRSCYELVELAKNLDLSQYLGTSQKISVNNLSELADKMLDYVGSSGHFTPITKMLSLYSDDIRLKDIEIYDTPGFNDPVVSRGTQTRKFLGQCDIVFLLSSINQFLTKSDLTLLREQLTSAGISSKAVHIIGTQRDLIFSMDRELLTKAKLLAMQKPVEIQDKAMVAGMIHLLTKKINDIAEQTINHHLSDDNIDESTQELLTHLKNKAPMTVAAISWRIAEQLPNLNEDFQESYERLCHSANYQFDKNDLKSFSNISKLREELVNQKLHKQQLLGIKIDNLNQGAINFIHQFKKSLIQDIDDYLVQLDMTNIEQLHRRQELLTGNLRNGKASILNTLENETGNILDKLNDLKNEFQKSKDEFSEIQVLQKTEIETIKREKTGIINSIISLFTGPRYEYREVKVVTAYAQVQDAIEQVESFADECIRQAESRLLGIIDLRSLNQKVAKSAIDLFDSGDADFDLMSFRNQVKRCLNDFTPPEIRFSVDNITGDIIQKFGNGTVGQDHISRLKTVHKQAIAEVLHQVELVVDKIKKDVELYFANMEKNLLENLISGVEKDVNKMKEQIVKKEASIQELQLFKECIVQVDV